LTATQDRPTADGSSSQGRERMTVCYNEDEAIEGRLSIS
jgi:hypothetical protein